MSTTSTTDDCCTMDTKRRLVVLQTTTNNNAIASSSSTENENNVTSSRGRSSSSSKGLETTSSNSCSSHLPRPRGRSHGGALLIVLGQKQCLGGLRSLLLILFGYTLQLIHLQSQFNEYHYSSPTSRSMSVLLQSTPLDDASGNQLAVPTMELSSRGDVVLTTALQKALKDFKEMGGSGGIDAGLDNNNNSPTTTTIEDPALLQLLQQMTAAAPLKRYDEYNCTLATGVSISLPPVPTFIIAGVQKGGTSALHSLLRKHPLLVAPKKFEPHFFDSNAIMKSVNDTSLLSQADICLLRELYSRNFKLQRLRRYPQMLSFEKTPSYIITKEAPERIKIVAPWAKIIVTLRNPVDRYVVIVLCFCLFCCCVICISCVSCTCLSWSLFLTNRAYDPIFVFPRHFPIFLSALSFSIFFHSCFSHYKMKVERNQIPQNQTFDEHLAMDLEVLRRKGRFVLPPVEHQPFPEITEVRDTRVLSYWKVKNLLYRGFYAEQLQHWIQHGGYTLGENLLVIRYERLNDEPALVFDEILDFLNVPRHDYKDDHFNKSYSPSRHWGGARNDLFIQSDATRQFLKDFYQPYNDELADLLGEEWRDVWNGRTFY
jgi:Sulfotransferase family/Sulfotransferase domain